MAKTIYYVYHKRTGRFAGSGTVRVRNAEYDCTAVAPDEELAEEEEEMAWQWGGGRWVRKKATEVVVIRGG